MQERHSQLNMPPCKHGTGISGNQCMECRMEWRLTEWNGMEVRISQCQPLLIPKYVSDYPLLLSVSTIGWMINQVFGIAIVAFLCVTIVAYVITTVLIKYQGSGMSSSIIVYC